MQRQLYRAGDMASDSNCKKVTNLLKYTHFCNLLPFEVNPGPCLSVVVRKTKTWFILTAFSVVTHALFSAYLINVLLFNPNHMGMVNLVFLVGILTVFLSVFGAYMWMLIKLEPFMSIVNTYWKLNLALCKYLFYRNAKFQIHMLR